MQHSMGDGCRVKHGGRGKDGHKWLNSRHILKGRTDRLVDDWVVFARRNQIWLLCFWPEQLNKWWSHCLLAESGKTVGGAYLSWEIKDKFLEVLMLDQQIRVWHNWSDRQDCPPKPLYQIILLPTMYMHAYLPIFLPAGKNQIRGKNVICMFLLISWIFFIGLLHFF